MGKIAVWSVAGAIGLVAAILPVEAILDWASRWNTVAAFRSDYRAGLHCLRLALALNALVLAAFPLLLPRMRSESTPDRRPELWPMAALYALTAALIAPGLGSSFQQDEWRCVVDYILTGPIVSLTRSIDGDNHLFYSLAAWPLVKAFGLSEVTVRLPAFLLTPLAPAVLFALLRRRYGLWPSILGAVPLAVSVHLVFWGHEGRAYGPLMAVILFLVWMQPRLLRGSMGAWGLYVAVGLAAVGLQIFSSLAVLALAVAPLLDKENRRGPALVRNLSALAVIGALSVLVYAPTLPQYLSVSDRLRGGPTYHLGALPLMSGGFAGFLSPVWAIPFAGALLLGWKDRTTWAATLAALIAAAFLFPFQQYSGASQSVRYYTPCIALLWIPIASGVTATFEKCRPGGIITFLGLLVAGLAADADYYRRGKQDFKAASRELSARAKPGESVVLFFDCRPMTYYLSPAPRVEPWEGVIMAAPPADWFLAVEGNLDWQPKLKAWVESRYTLEFRIPSVMTEVRGYRLAGSR